MASHQVRAVCGTTDADFTFRAAAHCANLFALRRTKPRGLALSTNRTIHNDSPEMFLRLGSILCALAKHHPGMAAKILVLIFSLRAVTRNAGYAMITLF
jgi:hypothetical protein